MPILQELARGDALVIVDMQVDFCPGGALPVAGGDRVVPVLNRWIEAAMARGVPVYASRDWHPAGHVSFRDHGGKWPPHCIQDSSGAAFHPALLLPDGAMKITKGVRFDKDQNSVFDETGLAAQLHRDGIRRLWVGGLAQDVCVLATVLDGLREGFDVTVVSDATRAVTADGEAEASRRMRQAGARFQRSG